MKQGPKKVVLVSTGAHNPPHPGHLQMLLMAKKQLQEQGFQVLETFTSPSHQQYIQMKGYGTVNIEDHPYPRPLFTDKERRRLWRRIIRTGDPSEAELHKYESKTRQQFVQYPEMMQEIIAQEAKNFPEGTCFVYVAGDDLAERLIDTWCEPSPYDSTKPRLKDVIVIARENELSDELKSKIITHQRASGADIATSVQVSVDPTKDMSSTGIMSGKISQLKLLPYPYLLELVNIISNKQPPQIDMGYKVAFLIQVSKALNELIVENPHAVELKILKMNVDKLMHEYNSQIQPQARAHFIQEAKSEVAKEAIRVKTEQKAKHAQARPKPFLKSTGKAKSATAEIAKGIGTFSSYKGMDGAPIYHYNQRQAYLTKQMMSQLNPAPGWETSAITTLQMPLTAQQNRQMTIKAQDVDTQAAFGAGTVTISVDTAKKLESSASIVTSQSLMPPAFFIQMQNFLSTYITPEERRTFRQLAGSYYNHWRADYQKLGFSQPEDLDKIADIPLNLLVTCVCHSQEVHFFVEQQLRSDGTAVNKLRDVNLDQATPNVLLSATGINFAYGGQVTEQYLRDGTAKMLIMNMWQGVLKSAVNQKCTDLALSAIGLGAFLPTTWPKQMKAEVAALYYDTLMSLLANPEFKGKFNSVHINPVFDFAKEELNKAVKKHNVTNVHDFNGDVKFFAIECAKRGIRCGLLNPSAPDVMLGKYDVGEYYKQGAYVGEEDFAATSTAWISSKGISDVYTNPARVHGTTIYQPQMQAAPTIQANSEMGLADQLRHYLLAANLPTPGLWQPVDGTYWGMGISKRTGNRAIANQLFQIDLAADGTIVVFDKRANTIVNVALEKILDPQIKRTLSAHLSQETKPRFI